MPLSDTEPAVVEQISVGTPRTLGTPGATAPMERPITTAVHKRAVTGAVWIGRINLAGDAQSDLRNHGGPDRAVLAYAAAHYPVWRAELGRPDLCYGGFGENFTISGQDETTVCIGDVYEVGEARLEVTQPRMPCAKISRRWGIPDLLHRAQSRGWVGWFMRVLREGHAEAGQAIRLLDRPYPRWPLMRAYTIRSEKRPDPSALASLAACAPLATAYRDALQKRLIATGSL